MADTTLKAIIDRLQAVLEAAPLSLVQTKDAFSHDRQPNTLLDNAYYIDDGGLGSNVPMGNNKAARLDRLVIYVAAKLKFAPQTAKETMETTLLTAERYIKVDGPSNGYHAELAGRRVTRGKGDFLIGSITVTVDYDVNEGTT